MLTILSFPAIDLDILQSLILDKETILKTTGSLSTVTIPVWLKKGYNVVEMGNPFAWAVDIDKFKLHHR